MLRHPNIVLFMGASVQAGSVLIVVEKANNSLKQIKTSKKLPPFKTRMNYAKQIASAMCWLHSSNPPYCMRDLNPSNVLIFDDGTVKVTDFAFSFLRDSPSLFLREDYGVASLPTWLAPEVLRRASFDLSCDVKNLLFYFFIFLRFKLE